MTTLGLFFGWAQHLGDGSGSRPPRLQTPYVRAPRAVLAALATLGAANAHAQTPTDNAPSAPAAPSSAVAPAAPAAPPPPHQSAPSQAPAPAAPSAPAPPASESGGIATAWPGAPEPSPPAVTSDTPAAAAEASTTTTPAGESVPPEAGVPGDASAGDAVAVDLAAAQTVDPSALDGANRTTPAVEPLEGPQPVPTPLEPGPASVPDAGETLGTFVYALVVDANYAVSSSHRDAIAPAHRSFVWAGSDGGISNGFALEWAGADLAYQYGSLAVRTSLRFGDGAKWLLRDRNSGGGLVPLAEAYLSWSPVRQLTFEAGQLRTHIGAETFDSYLNLNYSRGALFGLLQPWWHTGLRVRADLVEAVSVEGLVTNGANTTFDEDDAPSGGLRVTLRPTSEMQVELGGYKTFDTAKDASGYDTVVDVALRGQLGSLELVAAGMLTQVKQDPVPFASSTSQVETRPQPRGGTLWGLSGTAAYRLHERVRVAGRYEYVVDRDGVKTRPSAELTQLQTATLTLDVNPLSDVPTFALRWDNRIEWSNRTLFVNTVEEPSKRWFGSTLGFVFYTAP